MKKLIVHFSWPLISEGAGRVVVLIPPEYVQDLEKLECMKIKTLKKVANIQEWVDVAEEVMEMAVATAAAMAMAAEAEVVVTDETLRKLAH
jgi:hypothetical protein